MKKEMYLFFYFPCFYIFIYLFNYLPPVQLICTSPVSNLGIVHALCAEKAGSSDPEWSYYLKDFKLSMIVFYH